MSCTKLSAARVKSSLGRLAGSRERAVSIGVIYAVVQETVNLLAEFGFRLNSRLSFGLIQMPAVKIRRPPSINRLKPLSWERIYLVFAGKEPGLPPFR
jgi:hypothetical protein